MFALLFVLPFLAFFALIVGLNLRSHWKLYGSLPTFDDYRSSHPEAVRHGRLHCHHCSGGRIYVHSLDALRRRHICVACGTVLYRS